MFLTISKNQCTPEFTDRHVIAQIMKINEPIEKKTNGGGKGSRLVNKWTAHLKIVSDNIPSKPDNFTGLWADYDLNKEQFDIIQRSIANGADINKDLFNLIVIFRNDSKRKLMAIFSNAHFDGYEPQGNKIGEKPVPIATPIKQVPANEIVKADQRLIKPDTKGVFQETIEQRSIKTVVEQVQLSPDQQWKIRIEGIYKKGRDLKTLNNSIKERGSYLQKKDCPSINDYLNQSIDAVTFAELNYPDDVAKLKQVRDWFKMISESFDPMKKSANM